MMRLMASSVAPALDLRVHLRERIRAILNPE